ncbi:hypothetical protein SCHIN_v1c04320 [Spiroplasma chinense]|uniref:Uncharacterized protein n=2 Tax=Spiroplasma chinense TaxID=216932 RepID=A0A5B9Y4L9_9MOLU|nr:hypothetical protein SCHIN_v1c04320 [Spiroplasma chinense]
MSMFNKTMIFEYIWSILANKLTDMRIKDNIIKDDWLYGERTGSLNMDYAYSYVNQNSKFQESLQNASGNISLKDDFNFSYNGVNFTTQLENWVNNFYAMAFENNNGIPLQRMYYVHDKNDITKFSDVFGNNIASSIGQAKKIASERDNKILVKRYHMYDINGEETIINESDENKVVETLKKQINLSSKFVHKDELKKLADQKTDVTDLVTTKENYVFTFKASNGRQMYFKDYKSARAIFENQISLIAGISEKNIKNFTYSMFIGEKKNVYSFTNETNLNDLVKQIYSDLQRSKKRGE